MSASARSESDEHRGSVREGVVLGVALHLLGQSVLLLFLTGAMDGDIGGAFAFAMSVIGASQLPYMVPALVDAAVLRGRGLTARGLGIVLLGTLGANVLMFRGLAAGL